MLGAGALRWGSMGTVIKNAGHVALWSCLAALSVVVAYAMFALYVMGGRPTDWRLTCQGHGRPLAKDIELLLIAPTGLPQAICGSPMTAPAEWRSP
jgi:hypothetical protein